MEQMFTNTKFNPDLSQWDTGHVLRMNGMFRLTNAFNADISKWHGGGSLAEATALREYTEGVSLCALWWSWVADGCAAAQSRA